MTSKNNDALEALDYFKPPFKYGMGQTIYCKNNSGRDQMCLQVRGWGNLIGGAADNLPVESAEKVQDEFGQWVADTLNTTLQAQSEKAEQIAALVEALSLARQCIEDDFADDLDKFQIDQTLTAHKQGDK